MPDHKCSTCKHYESAPMWKKGWCRNPLLYSPQQSHLVGEDDLDCNRGMGSYWEAIDTAASPLIEESGEIGRANAMYTNPQRGDATYGDTGRFNPPPPRNIAPATPITQAQGARRPTPTRREAEPIVARQGNQQPVARSRSRQSGRGAEPLRSSDPAGYNNTPQEHYSWGDYLRRSYPVIGVILLLGAFWVWSARQLAGGPQLTPTLPLPSASADPSAAAPVVVITPSVPVAGGVAPTATLPIPPPGVIAPGARVLVTTSGAGANIRDQPSIQGVVVTSQDDGTPLTITGASQEADGYTWWPVRGEGFEGWVAEALISPAP